jgi:RNA ligase
MHHPIAHLPFHDLHAALEDRVRSKTVRRTVAPDNADLVLYTYTRHAVFERLWDPIVEAARGLILHGRGAVAAYPFPKFFNYGERSAALPDEPFVAYEKLDGSLGIVFFDVDAGRWRVATKGSFVAAQSAWAEAWLAARDLSCLVPGHTYLVEIIYAENRVVVAYDFAGLVLLGGYDATGCELADAVLHETAAHLSTRVAHAHAFDGVDDVLAAAAACDRDAEGFVVRFASGYRVKIKGSEYLRIHRLVSRVTPLALWESLEQGTDLEVMRREIPEEFWRDFDAIRALLLGRLGAIVDAVEDAKARLAGASDKEVGLQLSTLPAEVRPLIFMARNAGAAWADVPRVRATLLRHIRPNANALPGYTPSDRLSRAVDDA